MSHYHGTGTICKIISYNDYFKINSHPKNHILIFIKMKDGSLFYRNKKYCVDFTPQTGQVVDVYFDPSKTILISPKSEMSSENLNKDLNIFFTKNLN
ncbi:MAG: hypothetical protein AABY32_01305 [Nanoarchaeota archaeon]